jgi:Na+/H+ antiporter NhaD/arsenite permease-like protein
MGITWVSALASGVVDNIPFTATMIPVVERLEGGTQDNAYWWALALGACFGGNFTLVAAAANVAAAGLAERAGRPIGFVEFLKIGIPATLASLVLATLYLSRGTREGARSGSRVQPPTESWACQPRSVPATGPA